MAGGWPGVSVPPDQMRRCSCQWAALPPHPLGWHAALQNSLRVRPTWHSTLVSGGGPTCIHPAGLPHCQCAGVGVESWVWCCRSGGRRHTDWCRTNRKCDWCESRSFFFCLGCLCRLIAVGHAVRHSKRKNYQKVKQAASLSRATPRYAVNCTS